MPTQRFGFSPFHLTTGVRIAIGGCIFVVLAVDDLQKKGRAARRWREYLFLVVCAAVAMTYGALNDQISSRISWEYFYYGKELSNVLGPATPPDAASLHWQAALVGVRASWSVGLLIGAALLLANNPRRDRPPMSFTRLAAWLGMILVITATCATVFAFFGWFGWLTWCADDFRNLLASNLWRPRHFMACWGEHLGSYIGGLLGATLAVIAVVRRPVPASDL